MADRTCQRPGCGKLIRSSRRRDTRWCSRSCEGKARRAAERKTAFEAANPGAAELLSGEPQTLGELHERAGALAHRAGIDQDDDEHLDDDYAAQDKRIHELLGMGDEGTSARAPRRSWLDVKRVYARNPGVELPAVIRERRERYAAGLRAIQARLTSSADQPEDRFNPVTQGVVARQAAESRRLNRRGAASVSVPPAGFVFSAPEPPPVPRPGAPVDADRFWP
jgi:hypothetical protein